MGSQLNELGNLCSELRSDKPATRNKAADRLETVLTQSKVELLTLFANRRPNEGGVTWTNLLDSAVDAALKHAAKVEESVEAKNIQTMLNKNHVFRGIVNKLIEYNLEADSSLLSKRTIYDAVIVGFSTRSAIKIFGSLFLEILDRGLYKSVVYVRELKVTEFSALLSNLFEMNIANNDVLRFEVLHCIIKTIELAVQQVQINAELVDYLPELAVFMRRAHNDRRKADAIKLYHLFVTQLSVDFHHAICDATQDILPLACDIYHFHLRADVKQSLFHGVYVSLHAVYPYIGSGDFSTINITLKDSWPKTLKKLKALVDSEIKERKLSLQRPSVNANEKRTDYFIKLASVVVYLLYWHVEVEARAADNIEQPTKMAKPPDTLDTVLTLVQSDDSKVNNIWLSILSELICHHQPIINFTNYAPLLECALGFLNIHINAIHVRYIRQILTALLSKEATLVAGKYIPADCYADQWLKVVTFLITESSTSNDIIEEKQLILQQLIAYRKLSAENCNTLLQSCISNTLLRRNECFVTIQSIFRHADFCGFDKSHETVERFITWACENTNSINAKNALLNVAPIDVKLVADTCALAVINFLDDAKNGIQPQSSRESSAEETNYLEMLQYKYNRKFVALQLHGKELKQVALEREPGENIHKNCLFQCSYEKLMRAMNVEISKETDCSFIIKDMSALHKLTTFMHTFLQYGVFDESNFQQCPLIKRIGFFLSHMEFQLKNNQPRNIERTDLLEILQHLEAAFSTFTSNFILLRYLETQPLEELINFLGNTLKHSVLQRNNEPEDWDSITCICLRTLTELCASDTYKIEALNYVTQHRFNLKTDLNMFVAVMKIFCVHKTRHTIGDANIAHWFVDKLKTVFKLYYANVEFITEIVELLPAIFNYVQDHIQLLDEMFVALMSLLKIAFKKSYPVSLTRLLINSVRQIAHQCQGICENDNFVNICLSVAKFLQFPSLEIQFAVVNTVAGLMDANWMHREIVISDGHYMFCKQLIELMDYKTALSDATADLEQNRNAVTIQVLASFIAFSTYHQESALQELSVFCALRKYTEGDLQALKEIAGYYNCNLNALTKPYMHNLIHFWIAKKYPILKFPYFICSHSKDAFVKENLSTIASCLLLYTTENIFKPLAKYGSESELLKLALPAARAYLLPHKAKCGMAQTADYKYHINTLLSNLQKLEVDLSYTTKNLSDLQWETIYQSIHCVRDNHTAQELFGFPIFNELPKWYQLTQEQLESCLSLYVPSKDVNQAFGVLILKNPLSLLNVINALKRNLYSSKFPIDHIECLYKYCTAVAFIMNSLASQKLSTASAQYNAQFFVRDAILFCLQYLQNVSHSELRQAALMFLQHLLSKPLIMNDCCLPLIKRHLNDISKCLVAMSETHNTRDPLNILHSLLNTNQRELSEAIALLDEFPDNEKFSELRRLQSSQQMNLNGSRALPTLMSEFLNAPHRGNKGLNAIQQQISDNKTDLQLEGKLLRDVIQRLLELVRSSPQLSNSLEAAKCLGEIGSLRIEGVTYYFETDVSFYENATHSLDASEYFVQQMLNALDKLLLIFDQQTCEAICDIAGLLMQSKYGSNLLTTFPYFHIFQINHTPKALQWYPQIDADSIDWLSILKSTSSLEWNNWVCSFVGKLFECCRWSSFQALAQQNASFAALAVQPLIQLMLDNKHDHMPKMIDMLSYFFGEVTKMLNGTGTSAQGKEIYKDKQVIRVFLNICECLRVHNEWKVPLNLLDVARASNYCQAYFLSVLYLELWANAEQSKPEPLKKSTIISNETFQQIAMKAYQSIGCCDAIAGFLNPLQSRVDYLNLNNDWSNLLLESPNSMWDEVCTSVLKRNGMLSLADVSNRRTSDIDYEIRWRLGQWDTLVEGHSKVNTLNDMEQEFEKHHFNALKCLYNREEQNCLAAVGNARHCVLSILKEISVECLQSVYKYLTWLQLLQHAEDFCKVQFISDTTVENVLNKWQAELALQYGSFECKEKILAHQITLFKTAGVRASRKINDFFKCNPVELCLLKSIKECKGAGEINLAKRDIAILRGMPLSSNEIKLSMFLEDADVCFRTGKLEITQAILKQVLRQRELSVCLETVRAIQLYGEYLIESQTQTFETVTEKMFNASLEALGKFEKAQQTKSLSASQLINVGSFEDFAKLQRINAYQIIAKYADREYTRLDEYMKSDEFQMKCRIIKQNRATAETVGKQNRDHDKRVGATLMQKHANLDQAEVTTFEQNRTSNLCLAVEHYIKYCVIDEGASSAAIYRIIALWFANKQNETLYEKIKDILLTIPSYKFICALNQITARLNSKQAHFIDLLKQLLVYCLQEHPHHTLYQLYALVFAFNDGTNERSNDRTSIAKEIILKAKKKSNLNCIKQLESVFPALIKFANADSGKQSTMMLSEELQRLKNLDAVHCPTVELPVSPSGVYHITSIIKWDDRVSLVGGINAPKKLLCLCADGRQRPQLLKGKDDLRQDAVMQQVFCMMNDLLRKDPKSAERSLTMRTYKVVPLSMRSGILEWCENTVPIGLYLGCSGDKGAHQRYRPKDFTPRHCRQLAMAQLKSSAEKRLKVFEHICGNFKPVFHYFLLEKFPVPGVWFERRLAYTNSVAVTSMVGYIVGLGDRHTQNILVDEKTAEVVHIDFGIAFEQGKVMPTPETVPFRLTRDMIAPMGISETNGVFKKSCETTMSVMRNNPHIIMTILEVLLYDPLYIWKVMAIEKADSSAAMEEQNLTAHRALMCVKDKLQGKSVGIVNTYDVEVQVQRLINDAISKYNLCMLFPGWDAYV